MLKQGNQRFISGKTVKWDFLAQTKQTSKGQFPFAAVVSCLDSRIPPAIVFDRGIGDLFVARVACNFVNEKEWLFKGASETNYTFEIYSKKALLPEAGGIFILAYNHPKGHLAGYQVNTLSMGETDNLQLAITNLPQQECLRGGCWNCT